MYKKNTLFSCWNKLLPRPILIANILMFLAIVIFAFASDLAYLPIHSHKILLEHYDSTSIDKKIATPLSFIEKSSQENKTLEISGDFSVDPGQHDSQYLNLFQTAPINTGVRYELAKNQNGNYGSSLIIASKPFGKDLQGIPFGDPSYEVIPGKKYNIHLKIDSNSTLTFKLSSRNGNKTEKILSGEVSDIYRYYAINKIEIGSGFDESRKFHGQINNFQIKYTDLIPTSLGKPSPFIALVLLFCSLAITGLTNKKKIKIDSFKRSFKYFAIPPLIFSYPILQLYSANITNIGFFTVIKLILLVSIFSIFLYIILIYTYKDINKALLSTVLCSFVIMLSGRVYANISQLINPDLFIFFTLVILFLVHVIIIRLQTISFKFINIVSSIVYLLFVMSVGTAAYNTIKISSALIKKNPVTTEATSVTATRNLPDIYFIISDMYANPTVLKKNFSFNDDNFTSHLKSLGFFVASNATANYKNTVTSVPSMLNMSYIPKEIDSIAKIPDYDEQNQMALYLKKIGYKFIFINPMKAIIGNSKLADVNLTCDEISDFEGIVWGYSLFFRMNKFGNAYRNGALCGINQIKKAVHIDGPKFVFTHLFSPHPPYVFDANGNTVPDNKQNDIIVNNGAKLNQEGYLGQVQFISKKLSEVVDFILANSQKTPIIILQGDHGVLMEDGIDASGKAIISDDIINARMRPLAAYLFPNGGDNVLYDTISPINMTRGLMRYYFHREDLNKIPDYAYWSPAPPDVFNITDVTSVVRKQDIKN